MNPSSTQPNPLPEQDKKPGAAAAPSQADVQKKAETDKAPPTKA